LLAGLILAAGAGTRFGTEPKLLAELHGRPLLEHAIRAQCAVPELERVVVVLGAHAEALRDAVDFGRAEALVCADWLTGQSASLRAGASALAQAERMLVTLGDQPLITPAVIARICAQPPGSRAAYDGVPGHPVLLGRQQLQALATITGDRGARELLAGGALIECGDLGDGRDVDTPEDLAALRAPR
jgi:CTP:molybdopterin cytidylyltransferase MocA